MAQHLDHMVAGIPNEEATNSARFVLFGILGFVFSLITLIVVLLIPHRR